MFSASNAARKLTTCFAFSLVMVHPKLKRAQKIDLDDISSAIPEAIKGAPVNLRQPEGWIYSEKGISHIDEWPNIQDYVVPVSWKETPFCLPAEGGR